MPDSQTFEAAIAQSISTFTPKEKRIASYFSARPQAILIETNAEIARNLDISGMTLTRFYRKLGFKDAADARDKALQKTFGATNARADQRFEATFSSPKSASTEAVKAMCHTWVDAAFEARETATWQKIVELLAESDAVHVTGFQAMFYIADGFSRRLAYFRDRVNLLDGIDGLYAELLPAPNEKVSLVLMDVFRYGAHGPILAKLARERGIEVIIFADEFCDWADEITPHVIRYPSENHFFLPMPQSFSTGLNLLLQDISTALGDKAVARVQKLSKAQDKFGMFLD